MRSMKGLFGVLLATLLLLPLVGVGIAGAAPKMVIDRSHGQTVDLSGFTSVLTTMGWQVVDQTASLTAGVPSDCNLLVVPPPVSDSDLTDEVTAIVAYVRAGGGLLVLGEANGPELTVFQDAFGVRFNPDAVFSYDANSENFSVRLPADPTYHPYDPYDPQSGCDPPLSYDQVYNPILEGVPSLLYNGGCSLTVDPSKLGFLVTGGCLDIADVEPSFPPLLAATTLEGGRAVFFGDTDSVAANQQLFTNIVNWLKKPEALPSPPPVPGPTEAGPIPVTINIIPWCKENKIDLQSKGVIRVAVLSTPDFDVKQVHPKTVLFAEAKPLCWMRMDVDRDGDKDLLLLFPIHDLKLTEESTGAVLTGKTLDGKSFEGKDMVQIVEHKKCKKPEKPDNKDNNCGGKKGK